MLKGLFKKIHRKFVTRQVLNKIEIKEVKGEWEYVKEVDPDSYDPMTGMIGLEMRDAVQRLQFSYNGVSVGFGSNPPYWCGEELTWSFSSVSSGTLELIVDLEICSIDRLSPYLIHPLSYIRELARIKLEKDY